MLAFYAVPVLSMLMRSVNDPVWTLSHYASLTGDTVFLKVLSNTLYTSLIVTLGALVLGYPVALSLVSAPRYAPVILILILLPFWTSVLVRSYAWMVLMGRHGLINDALLAVGMIDRLALGFYITPAMLGGPREITLSMLIAQQVDQLNWAYAATLSVVLLATALAIIAAFYRLPGVGNAFRTSAR